MCNHTLLNLFSMSVVLAAAYDVQKILIILWSRFHSSKKYVWYLELWYSPDLFWPCPPGHRTKDTPENPKLLKNIFDQILCIAIYALLVVLCEMSYRTGSFLQRPLLSEHLLILPLKEPQVFPAFVHGLQWYSVLLVQKKERRTTLDSGAFFFLYICAIGPTDFLVIIK